MEQYAFNRSLNGKTKALLTTTNLGNLPDTDVKTLAIDRNNRIWLGTRSGMVVLNNASNLFESNVVKCRTNSY